MVASRRGGTPATPDLVASSSSSSSSGRMFTVPCRAPNSTCKPSGLRYGQRLGPSSSPTTVTSYSRQPGGTSNTYSPTLLHRLTPSCSCTQHKMLTLAQVPPGLWLHTFGACRSSFILEGPSTPALQPPGLFPSSCRTRHNTGEGRSLPRLCFTMLLLCWPQAQQQGCCVCCAVEPPPAAPLPHCSHQHTSCLLTPGAV